MSEHTAEPWICCIDETVTIRDSQDNQLGILTHLHTRTGGRRDADEVAANARRIVAGVKRRESDKVARRHENPD